MVRKFYVMLYCNIRYVIVYCITYSINTICYLAIHIRICEYDSSIQKIEYVFRTGGGHAPGGGAWYVYIANDRDGIF